MYWGMYIHVHMYVPIYIHYLHMSTYIVYDYISYIMQAFYTFTLVLKIDFNFQITFQCIVNH